LSLRYKQLLHSSHVQVHRKQCSEHPEKQTYEKCANFFSLGQYSKKSQKRKAPASVEGRMGGKKKKCGTVYPLAAQTVSLHQPNREIKRCVPTASKKHSITIMQTAIYSICDSCWPRILRSHVWDVTEHSSTGVHIWGEGITSVCMASWLHTITPQQTVTHAIDRKSVV
jgi:hypothetical protein